MKQVFLIIFESLWMLPSERAPLAPDLTDGERKTAVRERDCLGS